MKGNRTDDGYQGSQLWKRTLGDQNDGFDGQRARLRTAHSIFRGRIKALIEGIGGELPQLTLHDLSHIDALWHLSNIIIGDRFVVNPMEAFVLGSAFLLHDAAHVLWAYQGGIEEIRGTVDWKDLIARKYNGNEPVNGSSNEKAALFIILRELHAKQAEKLLFLQRKDPENGDNLYLLEDQGLRDHYGEIIGEIAGSHHWNHKNLQSSYDGRTIGPNAEFYETKWTVDPLKLALILRIADAAHFDARRAPWFLFALRNPEGVSRGHWQFQTKMSAITISSRNMLQVSSGGSFGLKELDAWWLSYDCVCRLHDEIKKARSLISDTEREQIQAEGVENISSPSQYAINVKTKGWEPIDVLPRISDVPSVIKKFHGAQLYGERPELALRELIQNAADAVRSARCLGLLSDNQGEIIIEYEVKDGLYYLHIQDDGIGMSKYVLSSVLTDFGASLWSSESLSTELPGLSSSGFQAVGRHGVGFFSVFMLGDHVIVNTRRRSITGSDMSEQWCMEFRGDMANRPILRTPRTEEMLLNGGTRISIVISGEKLQRLSETSYEEDDKYNSIFKIKDVSKRIKATTKIDGKRLKHVVSSLCPTLDIDVRVGRRDSRLEYAVKRNDWRKLTVEKLSKRSISGHWNRSDGNYVDLIEPDGELLGRLALGSYYDGKAVVTDGGLRSGYLSGFSGLAIGDEPRKIIRDDSRPLASTDAWREWAIKYIQASKDNTIADLLRLHPLCPEEDLPVYYLNGIGRKLSEVREYISSKMTLKIVQGHLEHEDYDDISRNTFNEHLKPKNEIIFVPDTIIIRYLPFAVREIRYMSIIEDLLIEAWGKYNYYEEDEEEVAQVGSVCVYRSCYTYYREDGQ